jgi:hypothetical protein
VPPTSDPELTGDESRAGLNRRQMIKAAGIAGAAAWTAPVIIDSFASPAAAISTGCITGSWSRGCVALGSDNRSIWTLSIVNHDTVNAVSVTPSLTYDNQCSENGSGQNASFTALGGTLLSTFTPVTQNVTTPNTGSAVGTAASIPANSTRTVVVTANPAGDENTNSRVNITASLVYTCQGGSLTTTSVPGTALTCGNGASC